MVSKELGETALPGKLNRRISEYSGMRRSELASNYLFSLITVIDLHLNWCGRCDCIEQNYRSLGAKHDGRVEFYSASEDFIPEDIKTNLQHGPLTCKPRFVIYVVSLN